MMGELSEETKAAVAAATDRALERFRERQEAEAGPRPPRPPEEKPTKDQAWAAWVAKAVDAEEPIDREAFERWWRGEDA